MYLIRVGQYDLHDLYTLSILKDSFKTCFFESNRTI